MRDQRVRLEYYGPAWPRGLQLIREFGGRLKRCLEETAELCRNSKDSQEAATQASSGKEQKQKEGPMACDSFGKEQVAKTGQQPEPQAQRSLQCGQEALTRAKSDSVCAEGNPASQARRTDSPADERLHGQANPAEGAQSSLEGPYWQKVRAKLEEYKAYALQAGEFALIEEKPEEFRLFTRKDGRFLTKRCQTTFPFSLEAVKRELMDTSVAHKVNKQIDRVTLLRRVSKDLSVVHMTIRCPFPVSWREFVLVCAEVRESERKQYVVFTSAEDSECKRTKGFVRGILDYTVYELTAESERETRVDFITRSDPKIEFLPKSIVDSQSNSGAKAPLYLKQHMERRYGKGNSV